LRCSGAGGLKDAAFHVPVLPLTFHAVGIESKSSNPSEVFSTFANYCEQADRLFELGEFQGG
jgi:hypothetical protein